MPHSVLEETELTPGPVRFSIFPAFRYREYRPYWLGGAFSNIGMWALIFGRLWLMHLEREVPRVKARWASGQA